MRHQYDKLFSANFQQQSNKKKNHRERICEAMIKVVNTATTDKVADVANISTLLDKNNNSEQANITKIISENNETNTLTFIQILEENNKQIKLEIMETLKLTIDEKNIALINKIDSKMKIMCKNFQTYLIRTTTKLVQS